MLNGRLSRRWLSCGGCVQETEVREALTPIFDGLSSTAEDRVTVEPIVQACGARLFHTAWLHWRARTKRFVWRCATRVYCDHREAWAPRQGK